MSSQPAARRGGEQGFTLVELLVVIVVLGILSGIVAFGVARFRSDATATACAADVVIVTRAATAYEATTGSWPSDVDVLVDGDYLEKRPGGTYRFDSAARTVRRDPACAAAGTGTGTAAAGRPILGIAGKCVDVAGASPADGTAVQLLACTGGTGQQWTVPASPPGPIMALGKCMAAAGTANLTPVRLSTCDGSAGQQWTADAGLVRHPLSGRCLDAEGASSADRTRLIIFDCHGGTNQRWALG